MMGWRFDYNAHWPYVNLVPHHYLYSYGRMQEVWPIPSPLTIRGPSAIGLTVTAMRVSLSCLRMMNDRRLSILHDMRTVTDRLMDAMSTSAARQYGQERVDELAHALQCAELAESAGADEELLLASLLHDVGRYAVAQEEIGDSFATIAPRAGNARGHHEAGADLLAPYVPERVAFLIRAHADAKRYLCATDPRYYDMLSRASKQTLTLQGGIMTAEEAERAATHPWWGDAIRLRRWDDGAKERGRPTRPLIAWKPLLQKYFDVTDAAR